MTVSVVMATFNGAEFLPDQLASIAAQTMPPNELIVCDDGSSDNTCAIIEAFAQKTSMRVRLERNEIRLGYSDNFMKASALAGSRYIAFSDQDDVWYPTKIEKSVRALKEHDAILCAHPVQTVDDQRRPMKMVRQEIKATRAYPPCVLDPWGMFLGFSQTVDRRILDIIPAERRGLDSNTFSKVLPHDRWMYFLGTHFGTVVTIDDCLADYRQHAGNTYGITPKSLVDRFRIKVQEGPPRLKNFETLAAYRLAMLKASRGLENELPFSKAIARWERIWAHCGDRYTLYTTRSLTHRAGQLAANIRHGVYKQFAGNGLGSKRFLEDVSLGLFGAAAAIW